MEKRGSDGGALRTHEIAPKYQFFFVEDLALEFVLAGVLWLQDAFSGGNEGGGDPRIFLY